MHLLSGDPSLHRLELAVDIVACENLPLFIGVN